MFYKCFEFNQPVTIPESVIDCKGMFHNCKDLNSPIAILSSKTQCFEMFRGCSSMKSPVYCTENQYNDSCLKKLGYIWEDNCAYIK
jgi:hypothetical protein